MSESLLNVDDLVVEYPGKGFRAKPFQALEGRLDRHQARRDGRPGRRVGIGQDDPGPGGARPRAGHRRHDHLRRQGHQPPASQGAPRPQLRDPGRVPGPVLVAEPVADDRADPRRAAAGARGRLGHREDAGARPARPGGLPADARSRLPREFSGGQRQRIAIARALALDPKLIVCDEPVSALDLSTQARVLDLFIEIQERTGVAYLFITHDLAVVRHISHRVAVMFRGEIVETGDGDQVTARPEHPYTQRLFMASPVPDPDKQEVRRVERRALLDAEATAAAA